jgi:hypothetical protein
MIQARIRPGCLCVSHGKHLWIGVPGEEQVSLGWQREGTLVLALGPTRLDLDIWYALFLARGRVGWINLSGITEVR